MTRIDLDQELSGMADRLPHGVELEAARVAQQTMPRRLRDGKRVRARWFVPTIVVGGLVLTAGASTTVVQMSHWAGFELPIGNVRSEVPIPVNWVTETGHREECSAYLEIRNPRDTDGDVMDAAIAAHDWSGLGQRLYDDGVPQPDDPDGEIRVWEGLDAVIEEFAAEVFPGVPWISADSDPQDRAVDAWGTRCSPLQ